MQESFQTNHQQQIQGKRQWNRCVIGHTNLTQTKIDNIYYEH